MSASLDILFEDERLIAINKPHGLLVHRTHIAADAQEFALQLVRNYVGQRVYPVHRLDRKTSGVLLFAKDQKMNRDVHKLFMEGKVIKEYHALVRGFLPDSGEIDYPIGEDHKKKEAITQFKLLHHYELDLPFGKWDTSRYSEVLLKPITGRFHQLRKHMAHIFHPILGDRPHGCNKQNKLWKERFNMVNMMLCATTLTIPYQGNPLVIKSECSDEYKRMVSIMEELQCSQ